jgi:translation initiation factor 1 (eIF-1/SUI1)
MPELSAILVAKYEKDQSDRRFFAAIQGVDLDKESGKEDAQKAWEDMKARVFSGGTATDSSDVTSLQGVSAKKAGFGVGMGLDYAVVSDKKNPKNPLRP